MDAQVARLVTEIPGSNLPRAVFFRDSFTSAMIPFLAEHFSRAVFLWEYDVNPEIIATERPQVVIQQIVGRHLGAVLPYNYVAGRSKDGVTDSEAEDRSAHGDGAARRSGRQGDPE